MITKFFRRSFVRESLLFGSSYIAYQASIFITYLIAAKVIGPKLYGLWSILVVILSYSASAHLGVLNAINREIPYSKGERNLKRAERLKKLGLSAALFGAVFACILTFVVSLFVQTELKKPLELLLILIFVQQFYAYFQVYLQSDRQFNKVSILQFLAAGMIPLFIIPLLLKGFAINGLIIGQTLAILLSSLAIKKLLNFKLAFELDFKEFLSLIKIGFPIMGIGLAFSLLISADRWIVLKFLTAQDLGYYSLATTIFSSVVLLPMIIAIQVYPRQAERFGETKDRLHLGPFIWRQVFASLLIVIPVILFLYLFFPYLINQFLNQYVLSITPLKILLPALLFLPLVFSFNSFLNIINKQMYGFIILIFAIALEFVIGISFVKMGIGINGVALGAMLTYIIYTLILFVVVVRNYGHNNTYQQKTS